MSYKITLRLQITQVPNKQEHGPLGGDGRTDAGDDNTPSASFKDSK